MTYSYFFLVLLLMPLVELGGTQEPCPTLCHCSLEILNCSRITSSPGFHQVPLPKPAALPHPFMYLDFTGNEISSIGKEVWKAYPWAEYLVLKENRLSRLKNSSLEGLLSLTYLDLSCNKIQIIERNAFEAAPFLQIIYLSGNVIAQIGDGTFRAWHGMQFLRKVDLSHNPLAVIDDSYFYRLPLLKLLDLSATKVTPRILEVLLQTSLQLRILILPKKMSCCLCRIKEDIEVSCDTVTLECTESCDINVTLCENEEPLNTMQQGVMKAIEIRKLNVTSLLTILSERAMPNNTVLERTKPNSDTPVLAQNYSSLVADFNLLKLVKRLMQMKADKPLDVNWTDKGELKKLYLLASLLQAALKETIVALEKESVEAVGQGELSAQVSKKSPDEATKASTDASLRLERHVRKVRRENWLGGDQGHKDARLGIDGQQVAMLATRSADKPNVFELLNEAESGRKTAESRDTQHALPFLRSNHVALQSSWKRSISDSLTNALKPTSSIIVDKNAKDLTSLSSDGKSVAVLGNGFGAEIMTKEELLNQLLWRSNPPAGDGNSKISTIDSEPSLNELLPDITVSHGTYWEHQRTSVSPLLNLSPQDDYWLQGDLFEAELNKQLTSLIPNAPVRRFISHVIRILKMDCPAPALQLACAKLLSKTGLLMKLFSENINETSSLWKPYFWPSKNLTNTTTVSSRKLENPLDTIASHGILAYGYGNKLLWAVLGTAILVIIMAVICLIQIRSQHSSAKDQTFLGQRKKPLPDQEYSRTAPPLMDKPLWLKDMYQSQDEIQEKNMAEKLHDEESLEEVDIVSWGNARPSFPEPPLKKISSKTLSILPYEMSPAPTAAPPPPPGPPSSSSQRPSLKKSSDTAGGASEATSSKAASAASVAEEGEDDEEGSAEKSENPTIEGTSEAPESGEGEEEEEDEESD